MFSVLTLMTAFTLTSGVGSDDVAMEVVDLTKMVWYGVDVDEESVDRVGRIA